MTKTSTAKTAAKKRAASTGKSKAAANAGKQALDKVSQIEGQLGTFAKVLENLDKKVDQLASGAPTKAQILAQHDKNERVINQVLKEEENNDFPPKPEDNLPAHLRELKPGGGDASKMARNNPVEIRETTHTEELPIGQLEERHLKSEGPAREALAPIRAVDGDVQEANAGMLSPEKLELERFLHEYVLVRLHDSTDETQIPIPEVGNGGINQFFIRGKEQWVRRKFIEPLARAKKTTYTQRKYRDENGAESYMMIPHTTLMYPFEVLQDTQKGRQWLRNILSESF